MTTIKDIAKLSGYGIGTVSRVINHQPGVSDKARKKVEQIIKEQNYEPNTNARILKQNISSAIAIVIKGYDNVFFAKVLQSVQLTLQAYNEEAIVCFLDENANEVESAIQLSSSKKPKGFIFLGGNLEYFKEGFDKVKVPSVLLTNTAKDLHFDNLSSFTSDDSKAGRYGVSYLISGGHSEIGVIGGSLSKEGSQVGYRRMQGIMQELKETSIAFDPKRQYVGSRYNLQGGYDAAKQLLKQNPNTTAIFALSDMVAMGAIRALNDLGKNVPNDVSVLGYDGIEFTKYMNPRLTTISQDIDLLVKKGVEDLLQRLDHEQQPVHELIPFKMLDGDSVLPLNNKKK